MRASDRLSTSPDCLLCLFVFILCHNRLMHIFTDIPFLFRNAPLISVTDESAFAGVIDHCSGVLHTLYHSQETAMCPLGLLGRCLSGYGFVLGGRWNALSVQFLCDLCAGLSADHIHEYTANDRSGFCVNDEMVLVSRVSFIPVGNSVYILGLFLFQSYCGLDLLGESLAVIIVNWRNIEKRLGCEVYFTDPYCAWQKGTNENSNGLLREFYPKGRNLSRVAPAMLKRNLALINARPRKVLNFRSAQDLWVFELSSCCT